jgi:hypothetical protein
VKSARIQIYANQRKQPGTKQPDGRGFIELPAQLLMELAQAFQAGQFTGSNQQGEPFIQLPCSCWRGDGTVGPNGGITVLSGQIESPAETAAYRAQQAAVQAPGAQGWGQPAAAPQQAWGAPAPQAPPMQPPAWGQPAPTPQPVPMQQPVPAQQPPI